MENLRFECTLLSSVRVSLSREERLPVTRNNRLPISFALSFTKRIRRIPYLSIFELFLRGNPFESRPFLSEKKKREKETKPLLSISSAMVRDSFLKKTSACGLPFFPSKLRSTKKIDRSPFVARRLERNIFFFFFLPGPWKIDVVQRTETDVLRRLIGIYRRSRHDFSMEFLVQPFRRGGETCSYKIISRVLRVGRS